LCRSYIQTMSTLNFVSHQHHVHNWWLANSNLHIMFRYVCDLSSYHFTYLVLVIYYLPSSNQIVRIFLVQKPDSYFTFYKNVTLTKVAYLLNVYILFQNPELSTASCTPASQVHMSDILIFARHFKIWCWGGSWKFVI
jgi:hypothetical protein